MIISKTEYLKTKAKAQSAQNKNLSTLNRKTQHSSTINKILVPLMIAIWFLFVIYDDPFMT